MTTIIATSGALGKRRCDAKCHTARPGSSCDCICGGRYHAVGGENAQEALTADWFGKSEISEDDVRALHDAIADAHGGQRVIFP